MPVHIPTTYVSLFRSIGRSRRMPPEAVVFLQGDPASHLYLVASGRVRAFALSPSGQEITLEVLEAGRIFGDTSFLSGIPRSVTIQTITETEIIVCRAEALIRLCHQSEELMLLLFQHMAETCNYLIHQVTRLVHYDSRQKVADLLLCESASRGRVSPSAELPYTHEEIARSVSLNRVTVSRILGEFKAKGMIGSRYGRITLLDRAALAALLPDAPAPQSQNP